MSREHKSLSTRVPEQGEEATVYYYSRRSEAVLSRRGPVKMVVEEEKDNRSHLFVAIQDRDDRLTVSNLETGNVYTQTDQQTVLGSLVALEPDRETADLTAEVALYPSYTLLLRQFESESTPSLIFEDYCDVFIATVGEIEQWRDEIAYGEIVEVENTDGRVFPISKSNLDRALGRFILHQQRNRA